MVTSTVRGVVLHKTNEKVVWLVVLTLSCGHTSQYVYPHSTYAPSLGDHICCAECAKNS